LQEINNLPARYIQAIFRQYHLFTKSQEAQQAAASEDMMEELEDGSMAPVSGSANGNNNSNEDRKLTTIREQQLANIRKAIASSGSTDPDAIYMLNIANKEKEREEAEAQRRI
jgi:hypothetical protein